MEDFQMHVISCMDSQDDNELVTMQNIPASTGNGSENRICPMCDATFPGELPQSEFERHVQEHFGEDPITDRFEVLRP
ncbi:hypothetical protein FSP39_009215 [Pinctada imbricata]|uniref:UBZ1-type domain-containing protein n=1 Tax=Pinctada imbricata TaxID=66713 RepID=A0AA88YIS7_PINIB|nr:hypothetical protein FSP39_009215 [Pinctada imbricata]